MNGNTKIFVSALLGECCNAFVQAWPTVPDGCAATQALARDSLVQAQVRPLLKRLQGVLRNDPESGRWKSAGDDALLARIHEFVETHVKNGGGPTDTKRFLMALRRLLINGLAAQDWPVPAILADSLLELDRILEGPGARIVMAGIAPERALTLAKPGIKLSQVISRATLRSSEAEASGIIGRRVTTIQAVAA